jgi:hypothetical protein
MSNARIVFTIGSPYFQLSDKAGFAEQTAIRQCTALDGSFSFELQLGDRGAFNVGEPFQRFTEFKGNAAITEKQLKRLLTLKSVQTPS